MKIKGGKAFRRAAQAAPKSAEGARKAPCSSVFIRVHLCSSVVNLLLLPLRPLCLSGEMSFFSAFGRIGIWRCLPQNGSFLPDLPDLPVSLPLVSWRLGGDSSRA
jgi:hypothetical protein